MLGLVLEGGAMRAGFVAGALMALRAGSQL